MAAVPSPIMTAREPTSSPVPVPKAPQHPTHTEVKAKLAKLLASLDDWIVPLIAMPISAVTIWHLYHTDNDLGLMAGAGAAMGVFAAIRTDKSTTKPILIAIASVYLGCHSGYCKIICRKLAYGEGFVASTIIIVGALLATSLQFPSLTQLWIDSTGLPGLWMILPLHMLTVYFSSLASRVTKAYLTT